MTEKTSSKISSKAEQVLLRKDIRQNIEVLKNQWSEGIS
jgi:hypothetical protein